jgi:hypothetical protein
MNFNNTTYNNFAYSFDQSNNYNKYNKKNYNESFDFANLFRNNKKNENTGNSHEISQLSGKLSSNLSLDNKFNKNSRWVLRNSVNFDSNGIVDFNLNSLNQTNTRSIFYIFKQNIPNLLFFKISEYSEVDDNLKNVKITIFYKITYLVEVFLDIYYIIYLKAKKLIGVYYNYAFWFYAEFAYPYFTAFGWLNKKTLMYFFKYLNKFVWNIEFNKLVVEDPYKYRYKVYSLALTRFYVYYINKFNPSVNIKYKIIVPYEWIDSNFFLWFIWGIYWFY